MKVIAVTQRVDVVTAYDEKRDALDQRWWKLLYKCGFTLLPLPNNPDRCLDLIGDVALSGIIFSGGNNLVAYGGSTAERDHTEARLLEYAVARKVPLLGVCRGMQFIQHSHGVELEPVSGHVCATQQVMIAGVEETRNSYHNLGTTTTTPELEVWAKTADGVVKAVRHVQHRIEGIMWHPERMPGFVAGDIEYIRNFFSSAAEGST